MAIMDVAHDWFLESPSCSGKVFAGIGSIDALTFVAHCTLPSDDLRTDT